MNNSIPLPIWKRAIDLSFVVAALPTFGALALLMATINKFGSRGPVFFKQQRVGLGGCKFICYKFRTMAIGADTLGHQSYAAELISTNAPMMKMDSKGDSRLIPGGWLLRVSGLDELPQILNVARGEMSLVGPRPCLPYEYEQYLPWHRKRLESKPGLTGLWQVSGKNRTTFETMVNLDIEYAKRQSVWMDAKIILMTLPALIAQVGDFLKATSKKAPPTFRETLPAATPSSPTGVRSL